MHQGRGIGSALLAPILERASADGTACYLETGTVRNASMRALLARLEVTDLPDLPDDLLLDVDTPGDLAVADRTLRGGQRGSPEPG